MYFIGQNHIIRQLHFILQNLELEPSSGINMLLVGPSGYGKTRLALTICEFLAGKDFEYYLGTAVKFFLKKRVIFIDEVHKLQNIETFYPIMDAKNHVLIFATNEHGDLPEPFVNRCWQFIFTEYDDDELLLICYESAGFRSNDESFRKIIDAGNRNPRVIKELLDKFRLYFLSNPGIDSTTADYGEILKTVFRIENGLDTLCRRYLEVLDNVGGTASINLMKNILHVNSVILQEYVEPVLLQKGLIRITSKGRTLV
jgi:Holliday junction resolvasome RuvABC ATP-dependent DNA helicase subunit